MKIVVITDSGFLPGEAEAIVSLLDAGAWRIHLRKPDAGSERTAMLLEEIPVRYRSRISLHDCHGLAERYGLGACISTAGTHSLRPDFPAWSAAPATRSPNSVSILLCVTIFF